MGNSNGSKYGDWHSLLHSYQPLYVNHKGQERAYSSKTPPLPCAQKIFDDQISTLPEGADSKH